MLGSEVLEVSFPGRNIGSWRSVLERGQVSLVKDPPHEFLGASPARLLFRNQHSDSILQSMQRFRLADWQGAVDYNQRSAGIQTRSIQ